jgi:Mn2+/Fe2+ NRAMP family transporter
VGRSAAAPAEPPSAREAVDAAGRLRPRDVLGMVGPGLITGGADNDPAGITTYSIVGAQNGYSQNWLMLLSTPLLIVVQQMSARVGNVTKTDLATALRLQYGRNVATAAVVLSVLANIITIGADLVMIASVMELVTGAKHLYFIVPSAVIMAYVTIFLDYKQVRRYLLWLVGIFATYIISAFLAHPDWGAVARGTFVPSGDLTPVFFVGAVGMLGTTITPYLLFFQSSAEIEERRGVQSIPRVDLDVRVGMIWSNVTAMFIMIVTGTVLFSHGAEAESAADIARALEPLAGSYAKYLFAVGIIGAGFLSIPVLAASTAYSVAGLAGWRRSLARPVSQAPHFYVVMGLAFLVGVQLAVSGLDPVKALFYSQVLAGLISPFLVLLVLLLTSNRKVMGDFANGPVTRVLGAATVLVLFGACAGMVFTVATSGLP